MVVVFDLDDTLYKERDYLLSAYREISEVLSVRIGRDYYSDLAHLIKAGRFSCIDYLLSIQEVQKVTSREELIKIYREHVPTLALSKEVSKIIGYLKNAGIVIGILTDGRSVTQRNKISALGLHNFVNDNDVVISDEIGFGKPAVVGYQIFESRHLGAKFIYIGDNPKKDFIAPNKLGWLTVGLKDNGINIHCQTELCRLALNSEQPKIWISSFLELENIISNFKHTIIYP